MRTKFSNTHIYPIVFTALIILFNIYPDFIANWLELPKPILISFTTLTYTIAKSKIHILFYNIEMDMTLWISVFILIAYCADAELIRGDGYEVWKITLLAVLLLQSKTICCTLHDVTTFINKQKAVQ